MRTHATELISASRPRSNDVRVADLVVDLCVAAAVRAQHDRHGGNEARKVARDACCEHCITRGSAQSHRLRRAVDD